MSLSQTKPVTVAVDDAHRVSGLLQAPPPPRACYVMAHGAGAGMTHPFMANLATRSRPTRHRHAALSVSVHGARREAARHAQARAGHRARGGGGSRAPRCPNFRLFAGGKSFGGRMTSQAQAAAPLPACAASCSSDFRCIRRASRRRARRAPFRRAYSDAVPAGNARRVCGAESAEAARRGARRARDTQLFEDADHSFHVPARSGRTDPEVRGDTARCARGVDRSRDCASRPSERRSPPRGSAGGD